MMKQTYEDYKYVMLDTAFLYLGAKYNYRELTENVDVPFKFRAIVERYILPEMDKETTLESHFYHMCENEFCCRTYQQLKVKVKVNRLREKRSLFSGKSKREYRTEIIPLAVFVKLTPEEKERDGIFIQEVVINKLAMMTFTL